MEVDCLVGPDSGFIADGMTPQEACLAIVQRSGQAAIDLDADTLRKLDLTFRMWPPALWEKARQMKASGQFPAKFAVKSGAYQSGDVWYVPIEFRAGNGKSEIQTPMIKFYQFEGKTFCFIIGTMERA